jgi:hypothetical protein
MTSCAASWPAWLNWPRKADSERAEHAKAAHPAGLPGCHPRGADCTSHLVGRLVVVPVTTLQQEARQLYAQAVADQGPAWANTANSIRSGYTNNWIASGIAAIAAVLRLVPDEADDEGSGAKTAHNP